MSTQKLERVLGLPAVTFIAVGFMIGGGVFVFTGLVVKESGPLLPLAYALAVVPVFVSMLPLAMLGAALPTMGASYRYPARMVSPGLAFTGVWIYALAAFFGQIPLYALSCAEYARVLAPGLPPTVFAIGVVTALYLVNLLGVRLAVQVQGVLVLILVAALLFYVFRGAQAFDPTHLRALGGQGPGGLLLGTALLTFTYFGANGIIELGDEIVDPGRVIPRAFFIAFPVVAVLYVGVALATVGAMPLPELQAADEPLIAVAERTHGPAGLLFFVVGGAILALLTTLNALFLVGTRALLVMVEDRVLPAALGGMSRFGTPHVLLGGVWLLSVAGIASGLSLQTLASYSALGGLVIFGPIQVAALRLPRRYPEQYEAAAFKLRGVWFWLCPIVGLLMVGFFGLVILVDLGSPLKIGVFLLFAASGAAVYLARRRQLGGAPGE